MDNHTIHTLQDTIPTTTAAASMENCCLLTILQLDLAKLTQTATVSALKLARTLNYPSLQAPNVSLLVTIMEVLRRDPNNNMVAVLLNAEEVILANHMVVTDNNTVVMDNNLTAMVITSNTTLATAAVNRLPLAPAVTSQPLFQSPFLVEY